MAIRYDKGAEFQKPYRADQGHLRAEALATRSGVFRYYSWDGSHRDELRHPDQVSDPRSLATLGGAPISVGHPPVSVSPKNFKQYGAGVVGDKVEWANPYVKVVTNLQSQDAIDAIEQGVNQVSLGYETEIVPEVGVWEGQPYTHRQIGIEHEDGSGRYIHYNHLAIVPKGRAGDEVRLQLDRLDVADGVDVAIAEIDTTIPKNNKTTNKRKDSKVKNPKVMTKIKLDDIQEIELSDAATASAIADKIRRDSQKIVDLQKSLDEITGTNKALVADNANLQNALATTADELKQTKLDKAAAEAKAQEKPDDDDEDDDDEPDDDGDEDEDYKKKSAKDSVDIYKLARERASLLVTAEKTLSADKYNSTNLDSMSNSEIQKAIIAQSFPGLTLDSISDAELSGMFKVATQAIQRSDSTVNVRQNLDNIVPRQTNDDATVASARTAMSNRRMKQKSGIAQHPGMQAATGY